PVPANLSQFTENPISSPKGPGSVGVFNFSSTPKENEFGKLQRNFDTKTLEKQILEKPRRLACRAGRVPGSSAELQSTTVTTPERESGTSCHLGQCGLVQAPPSAQLKFCER